MSKLSTPSAVPLTWAVRRPTVFILSLRECGLDEPGQLLGYVSERMWFDARREACSKFGVSPDEIELESLGPTSLLDEIEAKARVIQERSKVRKVRRKKRRQ